MDVSLAEARNREKKDERDLLVVYQLCYFIFIYIYIKTLQSKSIYNIIKGKKIHDTHTHTHTHTYAIIHAKKEVN